jgi:hypothetical protein
MIGRPASPEARAGKALVIKALSSYSRWMARHDIHGAKGVSPLALISSRFDEVWKMLRRRAVSKGQPENVWRRP